MNKNPNHEHTNKCRADPVNRSRSDKSINKNKLVKMNAPFKVFCVAAGDWNYTTNSPIKSPLIVGNEYTVRSVMNDQRGVYYNLSEIPNKDFYAELFATLPDTSEEVAVEQEREAIIYQR